MRRGYVSAAFFQPYFAEGGGNTGCETLRFFKIARLNRLKYFGAPFI